MELIYFLIIGGIAGWLAGLLMKGRGYGVLGNIVVGIVGSILGGYLFSLLKLSIGGAFGPFLTAFIGAVILLWIVGKVFK